ncbi:hypothetical protein RHGRI_021980 [Rhododendron griersonianum]|uniref:Uncharacterized protein n=1 Tax=Rhododendron griersonianum TaxID=479676 RepID=A0AAV6JRU8_9ERIC|nr:hypothetical protein RHGRI_021980 [Rhododendron griersonianum]
MSVGRQIVPKEIQKTLCLQTLIAEMVKPPGTFEPEESNKGGGKINSYRKELPKFKVSWTKFEILFLVAFVILVYFKNVEGRCLKDNKINDHQDDESMMNRISNLVPEILNLAPEILRQHRRRPENMVRRVILVSRTGTCVRLHFNSARGATNWAGESFRQPKINALSVKHVLANWKHPATLLASKMFQANSTSTQGFC